MFLDSIEPTDEDLSDIERELPLILADLDELDAEIQQIYAEDPGGPSELDWRRYRRIERQVMRAVVEVTHVCSPLPLEERRLSACRSSCEVVACPGCGTESVEHRPAYGCPTGAVRLAA